MTPDHADRIALLDQAALLAGFDRQLSMFPDRRQPDVLRVNLESNGLFIGEAKATETPDDVGVYLRLRRYFCWLSAHLARPGRWGLMVLCVPVEGDPRSWAALVEDLRADVLLPLHDGSGVRMLDSQNAFVWQQWE